jgi:hypothetical protein
MIAEARRPQLLVLGQRIADTLSRVQTPTGGGKPYDRNKLAILWRFLQARTRDPEAQRAKAFRAAVTEYLQRLPGSHHSAISRSARPQLEALERAVRDIVPLTQDEEELVHVLRWAERVMMTKERQVASTAGRDGEMRREVARHQPGGPGRPRGQRPFGRRR